jgi:hypothetical protein
MDGQVCRCRLSYVVLSSSGSPSTCSDPLFALRTFDSNPLNSHEIVAGGTGARLTIVNTSQGKVAKNVSRRAAITF